MFNAFFISAPDGCEGLASRLGSFIDWGRVPGTRFSRRGWVGPIASEDNVEDMKSIAHAEN